MHSTTFRLSCVYNRLVKHRAQSGLSSPSVLYRQQQPKHRGGAAESGHSGDDKAVCFLYELQVPHRAQDTAIETWRLHGHLHAHPTAADGVVAVDLPDRPGRRGAAAARVLHGAGRAPRRGLCEGHSRATAAVGLRCVLCAAGHPTCVDAADLRVRSAESPACRAVQCHSVGANMPNDPLLCSIFGGSAGVDGRY